ncbi:sensor histidine kinase [Varunaivibrio sulfuroxidans]|uniref:histidine kinase n=1 Tax=Varunaivibrio sulfuroxidans TaxID=1773489 RepID=A0A4R3J7E4_9PROT|nr:sensor histidine kinase [Varunaivibrio sulfuroxidans]TCS61275.1 Na+/proline symporter [Varunaivibrio sulfuroxidans]WES31107.1 sensor histidine kinase [Varunaivibrio sulfuroxidans]
MLGGLVVGVSFAYLGGLFAIASYGERRAAQGRSLTKNPYVYTLSLAVYCTSWTFYGSVGRAAHTGLDFLPIYIGPTLMFAVWPLVWVKIVRICKVNRITSIADFISSRYGKNVTLGAMVTVIAVIGITPYIALQLKSIATSYNILVDFRGTPATSGGHLFAMDTTLIVALILAMFAILFGTRHITSNEHHEGLVTAIAFESLIKLFAFVAVGVFVTFSVHGGFGDLFAKAMARADLRKLLTVSNDPGYSQWVTMTLLSMAAILFLPRQFYITAVENSGERQLRTAVWLFPLYLLASNIFVLPIALGGKMIFAGNGADADMFVLTVPIHFGQGALALFAFVGGLSAATSMVIVASIALSTMVCNNLAMPFLLRWRRAHIDMRGDVSMLLLTIRRTSIVAILLLGYGYFRIASESYSLVTIGLVSFSAIAQFAPAMLGGMFWKGATRRGAQTGLLLGFGVWIYTLLLPSFSQSGWLDIGFVQHGPFAIGFLKPYALFGLTGFDHLSHSLFWSMVFNIGGFVGVSVTGWQSAIERIQATSFVDVFARTEGGDNSRYWRGSASIGELRALLARFLGDDAARRDLEAFAAARGGALDPTKDADTALIHHAEKVLAGAIGSAAARVMIATVVKGEVVGLDAVYSILDETTQVIEYSRMLEIKSAQLEEMAVKLQAANNRLKEFDSLKDDFLSTVSHELRTPLTSIRAFGEILSGGEDIAPWQRQKFLMVITQESERLTRLIDQILDLAKMEAGRMDWRIRDVDLSEALNQALTAMSGLMHEHGVTLHSVIEENLPPVRADRDQFIQVATNLLSNAAKFCRHPGGEVEVVARKAGDVIVVSVRDNGDGILPENREYIFEKFHQTNQATNQMPRGTGLGLAICRQIITFFGGRIWVEPAKDGGARFVFQVPIAASPAPRHFDPEV